MKTAIEWLVDYIENQNKNGYEFHPKYNEHIVQQAKEMEKQQILDSCNKMQIIKDVDCDGNVKFFFEAEQYYKKTFNK